MCRFLTFLVLYIFDDRSSFSRLLFKAILELKFHATIRLFTVRYGERTFECEIVDDDLLIRVR